MGEIKGFLKYNREDFDKQAVSERIQHYKEFTKTLEIDVLQKQGARCMDCGIPFCQSGCPVDNLIPEWNDFVYKGKWEDAVARLKRTNNFPEFTGRVCPAPCENSCVLSINQPAVTIKNIEVSIIEKAYASGMIKANLPKTRTDKKVAVIGSGPAGLACADQLNQLGHNVTVYEKNEVIGGLLTLGIPDFKLEKSVVERRVKIMQDEGIEFKTGVNIGKDIVLSELNKKFDSIVLCGGAEKPRDLQVKGRDKQGVHYAMDFLTQQNRIVGGRKHLISSPISARDKSVIVIGGGDTGSDCIGTSIRQGAKSVTNFELLPQPPEERDINNPWPQWAFIQRTSSSHEEGCKREYAVMTKEFLGSEKVEKIKAVRLDFGQKDPITGRKEMKEIPGSEFEIDADLVLLAMGFVGPTQNGLLNELNLKLDERGNVKTDTDYMTSTKGIFAAGDMRRGQSLVVWAINEGRNAAEAVNKYLS